MSQTRQPTPTEQNHPLDNITKTILISLLGGLTKSLTYIPAKFSIYINTAEEQVTWRKAARELYKQGPRFFYGLDASIISSSVNYIVFFGLHTQFRYLLKAQYPTTNDIKINSTAATFAAILTTYLIAPLSWWKQGRMLTGAAHHTLWKQFRAQPLMTWRGSTAKIMTDGIYTGILFSTLDSLKNLNVKPMLAGGIAGCMAGLFSNFFAVVYACQRKDALPMRQQIAKIYTNKGIAGFYPQIIPLTLMHMWSGIIMNHLKCYIENLQKINYIYDPQKGIKTHGFYSLSHTKKRSIEDTQVKVSNESHRI